MELVYRKTDKGMTEIETRANRLPMRLRTALIMVDGRRSSNELKALMAGEADEALSTLLSEGYIKLIATLAPRAAGSPAPAAPAGTDSREWQSRRRDAIRFLTDHLGPTVETVLMKIEKMQSWDEVVPHLQSCLDVLRSSRGAAKANEFAEKFLDQPAP